MLLQHTLNQIGVIGIGSGLYLLQDRFVITCFGEQLFKPSVLSRQHYCARSNQNQVSPFPVFTLPLSIPTTNLQRGTALALWTLARAFRLMLLARSARMCSSLF